ISPKSAPTITAFGVNSATFASSAMYGLCSAACALRSAIGARSYRSLRSRSIRELVRGPQAHHLPAPDARRKVLVVAEGGRSAFDDGDQAGRLRNHYARVLVDGRRADHRGRKIDRHFHAGEDAGLRVVIEERVPAVPEPV